MPFPFSRFALALGSITLFNLAGSLHANETVPSRIVSIGLFKNGFAVVRREVDIAEDGIYRIADVPQPVHGTLWVESDAELVTRVTTIEVTEERPLRVRDFQTDLAGQAVTLHFHRADQLPLHGTVVDYPTDDDHRWNRHYPSGSPRGFWWGGFERTPLHSSPPPSSRFVVLDTDTRRVHVDAGQIARIETDHRTALVTERRPVLEFDARQVPDRGGTISLLYLTKGIAWAPSYRLDLTSPDTGIEGGFTLEQKAVIRNEFGDLEDVSIELISGFPNIDLANVLSPLAVETNWASFFTQLAQGDGGIGRGSIVTQQSIAYNSVDPSSAAASPVLPEAEGIDVYYHGIGRQRLREGDSLLLAVARSAGRYERIVEWKIPDARDAHGLPMDDWRRRQLGQENDDTAWDAVRFANPFDFPMTSAPAMVLVDDRFRGQRTSYWVNPGERTTLPITKALSVRTQAVEHEEPNTRELIAIGGHNYRRVDVRGTLTVCNHRKRSIRLVVERQFSGELVSADRDPKASLREDGVYSVNARNQLEWSLDVAAGEELTLEYHYRVLVRH